MASTELPGFGGKRFILTVDPKADAAYLRVRDRDVDKTVEVNGEVNIDYDSNGKVVGIEILRGPD